jgi:transposase
MRNFPSLRSVKVRITDKTVVAWVMRTPFTGEVCTHVRTCATTTESLLALAEWWTRQQVTHVAMDATGVSWRLICPILEGAFPIVLVTAQQRKAVPGRQTDGKDGEWLADVRRHGFLNASVMPPPPSS